MTQPKQWPFIEQALSDREMGNRYRTLHPLTPQPDGITVKRDGKKLINFSSNDYLGLSRHPLLSERAKEYVEKFGAGATASRMISGTYEIHDRLERKIADTFHSEAALLFNSGFQANSTILQALTDRHSLILADKLSHNSLLQGALLSRATFKRYEHNDLDQLEILLQKAVDESYNRILVITETVFSMDGDRCDLNAIIDLTSRYEAMLFADDAHAVGVWGSHGRGHAFGRTGVDLTLGTFGKAFGVFGAFVTCSNRMREYLINFCSGFIYTTALPPQVIGALDAAVDLIPSMNPERKQYHKRIEQVRNQINGAGFSTGNSTTQILPLIIGSEQEALSLADFLEKKGILATAIRPPTVPEASSRIRITLSSRHTDKHIKQLLNALVRWNER